MVPRRVLLGASGLALGSVLGAIGLARILTWRALFGLYGEHALLLGLTFAASLLGVVLWGTLAGSRLPFVLRALGLDPASASAPFVATLVDVSGILIYVTAGQPRPAEDTAVRRPMGSAPAGRSASTRLCPGPLILGILWPSAPANADRVGGIGWMRHQEG